MICIPSLPQENGAQSVTIAGTVQLKSDNSSVTRTVKVFNQLDSLSAQTVATSGIFSMSIPGNKNDKFNVVAVGNAGENSGIISGVSGIEA